MYKVGDVVTVYVDGFDRPWKSTGVVREAGDELFFVRFLDDAVGWWYEEKHLNEPSMDDLKETLRRAL